MGVYLSATMSVIDGTTKFFVKNGNESSDRVLISDSSGLVDWVGVKSLYTSEHYIGELYGGGIVVGIWVEGGEEKILISALQDGTSSYTTFPAGQNPTITLPLAPWSGIPSSFANATSLYDGKSNYSAARSLYGFVTYAYTSGAVDIDNFGSTYTDWYLPSLYEMKMVYDSAAVINRTLGDGNLKFDSNSPGTAKYWTSTETNASSAWLLDFGANGTFATASKTDSARIRPVRLERKTSGSGLVTNLDATNKLSYNDSKQSNRWADLANYGLTSSYSFGFSLLEFLTPGLTYSPSQGGYMIFNGNSYINFNSPIGDADVVSIEMWARIKPESVNRMLFGWNNYDVYLLAGGLGYNTGNGDMYGLSASRVTELGLFDRWTHYVFEMRSGVSYTNNKIYINGVEQTYIQTSGVQSIPNTNFNGGYGKIGAWGGSLTTGGGTPYLGIFDLSVFKVYKRALTQTEITDGYNKYRRKYEIGIQSSHSMDVGPGTGTFSITQNLVLNLPGKKNQKVLRSDSDGSATWVEKNYLFYRPDNQRFVGETFGGGIIVSKWNYPANVFNYLIMSKNDINVIVTDLKYGGSTPTRLMVSYDLTSWLSVGQIANFLIGSTSKSIAITSVASETGPVVISSGTLNQSIPDGSPGTAVISPALFVDQQFTPTLIEVVVNLTHPYLGDLRLNLVSPSGNAINLYNRQTGNTDNFTNTVFSSDLTKPSITTGTNPYTGTFSMNATLGVTTGVYTSNVDNLSGLLAGNTAYGNWYLAIQDFAGGDTGTLLNWSLRLSGPRTTILLNETLTSSATYETSKRFEIGTTGLSVPWSSVTNTSVSTNNFNGASNSVNIMAQAGNTHSAALLCRYYSSDGFGDWYLPSAFELHQAFGNLAATGYVFGTAGVPSGEYWSSTQINSNIANSVSFSGGNVSSINTATKSQSKKVRAFRQVSINANYKSWGEGDIWTEPIGDWYTDPWDESRWTQFPGIRQSNMAFHFNTDHLQSYPGLTSGFAPMVYSLIGSYTGNVLNGVTWSSDDRALVFNGTNSTSSPTDSVIDFGNSLATMGTFPITLEAWIKPTYSEYPNLYKGIITTCAYGSNNYGLNLSITYNSVGNIYTISGIFSDGLGFQSSNSKFASATIDVSTAKDSWNHICVVFTSATDIKIYINGSYRTTTISGSATTIGTNASGKTLIGTYQNSKYVFGGSIGAVRAYNAALSAKDVKNNFENDRVRYGI